MENLNIIIPANKTINQFGDFITSKNEYKDKITNIKRPNKRKARTVIKIDNSIDILMNMGKRWENANHVKQTEANRTKNKRCKKKQN